MSTGLDLPLHQCLSCVHWIGPSQTCLCINVSCPLTYFCICLLTYLYVCPLDWGYPTSSLPIGTVAEGAPIIPISAQLKYNIEVICEYISKKIPIPVRDFISPPRLIVIRSFDVNKPGAEVEDLKGGVAGGSILRGVLKVSMVVSEVWRDCPLWVW